MSVLPRFEHHAPTTLDEALALTTSLGQHVRILAGGTEIRMLLGVVEIPLGRRASARVQRMLEACRGNERAEEVRVAQQILQSMQLRSFTPAVVACPGCGRTSSDYFQRLARDVQDYLRESMPVWRKQYPGVERMSVAVMGCVVNGPGESRQANIGISLPGTGERPVAPVYVDGEKTVTLKGDTIAEEFQAIIADYVSRTYGVTGGS